MHAYRNDQRKAKSFGAAALNSYDIYVADPRETDIVIPCANLILIASQADSLCRVLGLSGAGNTTFINRLLGREPAKVGHGLYPMTTRIQYYTLRHPDDPNRRLIIVDALGFSGLKYDAGILDRVSDWLAHSYRDMVQTFAGVIYVHDLVQPRTPGMQLRMFKHWCDAHMIKNSVLATTKWPWELVTKERAELRERELEKTWKDMFENGQMCRFVDTRESARYIGSLILQQVTGHLGQSVSNLPILHGNERRKAKGKTEDSDDTDSPQASEGPGLVNSFSGASDFNINGGQFTDIGQQTLFTRHDHRHYITNHFYSPDSSVPFTWAAALSLPGLGGVIYKHKVHKAVTHRHGVEAGALTGAISTSLQAFSDYRLPTSLCLYFLVLQLFQKYRSGLPTR